VNNLTKFLHHRLLLILLAGFYALAPGFAQPLTRPDGTGTGPGRLTFCGEPVPTEQQAVAQRLAGALASGAGSARHVNALRLRSAPYFAVIEPVLRQYGIPNDFKYLPLIESAWRADAVSTAGAVGYWQFMDDTAKDLGLRIDPAADDRKDLRKSTDAACRYLRFLHNRLHSWTLAAAAFNGGIGMIERKVSNQGHANYYRLAMNDETSFYLYRILAMKELFGDPARYAGLVAGGPGLFTDNPYEREQAQARRMGWLQDTDPELTGTPIESLTRPGRQPGETALMDSLLADLLSSRPPAPVVIAGDVEAELVLAGKAVVGQSWSFRLTRPARIDETDCQPGDLLYALVDDVDAQGRVFLRAAKIRLADGTGLPVSLIALNPVSGLAGLPLPKPLKPGWRVQWNVQ
jgi:membrane-bound lytic murein transglycosylase D